MALNNRNYEEKRNFIRMTLNASAELTLKDGATVDVTCIDLSATGMALQTTQALPTGTDIHVNIQSPNAQFNSMAADGIVVRCQEIGEQQFELGVEIKQIT